MNPIFNKEFWLKAWEKDKETDTYTVHRGFSTPEYWNKVASSYDRDKEETKSRRLSKTLDLFKRKNMLSKGMEVLDIGCGTGRLAMALARYGAKVTALDFSTEMLEQFRQSITPDIRDNITLLCEDWHTLDIEKKGWKKKFDLVVAFMSPGVASPESFYKMMDTSKNGCAIRGWAAKRNHPVLSVLWEKIMGTVLEDSPQSILLKINLLFSLGLFPELTFDTVKWDQNVTVEAELESELAFFRKVSDKTDAELESVIRPFLESISENGRIIRSHKGLTATAVWSVNAIY
ncbi:MAG: methyltransferase domain-containing protein [Desulfobacula sp.]|jgi:SAM-dependent methyltransferase